MSKKFVIKINLDVPDGLDVRDLSSVSDAAQKAVEALVPLVRSCIKAGIEVSES